MLPGSLTGVKGLTAPPKTPPLLSALWASSFELSQLSALSAELTVEPGRAPQSLATLLDVDIFSQNQNGQPYLAICCW